MFGLNVKIVPDFQRIKRKANAANFRNFFHAAARIRRDAISSIERSEEASLPGQPPHSRKGRLPRAIRFAADKDGAVIGPRESIVGTAGSAHEFGGEYRGDRYDERPFMFPALDKSKERFVADWAGTIGE